ncbi:LPXTG cell wall anchor domain-containing protein [Enterococcus sp. DIV0806c]|uniref:LPXTG cell wall anchor domain-containing protein n=1 Tax=unclassified Enterococcus TaxID=2608891 RepID=UPI003F21E133
MKLKKSYILSIGMLLTQVYAPLVVYGAEVRLVENEGTIGFTGVYERHGTPDPAPEGAIKPDLPKEIIQQPSEVRRETYRKLPKTNEERVNSWTMFGLLLVIMTLGFWFWVYKKIQIKKVGFK